MTAATVERCLAWVGGAAGLGTLGIALAAMATSLRRPTGRTEPGARFALRPMFLVFATVAFLAGGILLWRPLPIGLGDSHRVLLSACGCLLTTAACGLYLWGLRSLGMMFGPSSGFGVRLHAGHQLVVHGPYAYLRHPMYLAVMSAAVGSLLLYRTWATLAFAIIMFGLIIRARREERVLSDEFGEAWREYAARVPGWIPRLRRGPNT
jgi:protein-S-isoprenylcysteine O-methyltransferase Ste14